MNISYSGVVIDDLTRSNLLAMSNNAIPMGWEVIAHHMTITMGPLLHRKGKHDFTQSYPPGSPVDLPVIAVGMDDRAMAVQVAPPAPISHKITFPHVTVAVNREGGGKPFHSNKIPPENFQNISHLGIVLKGTVVEVPQM